MTSRLDVIAAPLAGLALLQRRFIGDSRGYLERMYCADELAALLGNEGIVQINHTLTTRRGTVRGMHFQFASHAETKIVSCLRGEVFDVAIDLRRSSPTFLRWHGEVLSSNNHRTFYIPKGFAHGFQTLADECELLYLHTASYRAEAEGAINALDPRIGIAWPLPISGRSARDSGHPMLDHNFTGAI